MGYVVSAKAIGGMNIEEMMKEIQGGFFHVMPAISKLLVINLGMTKEELLKLVAQKISLSIFDGDFQIEQLKSVDYDGILISNGKIDSKKFPEIVEKLKLMIGNKPILSVGLGKDMTALALQDMEKGEWLQEGSILKNEIYKVYGIEGEIGNAFEELLKYI